MPVAHLPNFHISSRITFITITNRDISIIYELVVQQYQLRAQIQKDLEQKTSKLSSLNREINPSQDQVNTGNEQAEST